MDLENRISLLVELGKFMQSGDAEWAAAKTKAFQHNAWFIPDFINRAVESNRRSVPAARPCWKNGWKHMISLPGIRIPKKWVL